MSLKSFFKKIKPGKKEEASSPPTVPEAGEAIQEEIPLDQKETRIEALGSGAEIDIFVNNEKVNIHSLSDKTTIGRDPSQCDIIISELIVSKHHCTFYSEGGNYFVRDEGSTNGVFINNEKITQEQIRDGDVILLGKKGAVRIVFHQF
jgi:pSer/pThr/pTyr-binding forkhead associated (FHA) protein